MCVVEVVGVVFIWGRAPGEVRRGVLCVCWGALGRGRHLGSYPLAECPLEYAGEMRWGVKLASGSKRGWWWGCSKGGQGRGLLFGGFNLGGGS